ncbi:sensor histidine kinase [Jatrophihabitans fulvus]
MITVRRLVGPIAVLAATLLGSASGLALAVLVHGRLPERQAVVPVTVGTVVAVLVGVLAARPLRSAVRAAVPSLRRAPGEVTRRISEAVAQRLPTDELLRRSAEALRAALDSPRVELWIAVGTPDGSTPPELRRAVTLGQVGPAPEFSSADLRAAARAGVAGEGWARRWLPQLLAEPAPGDLRRAPMRVGAVTEAGQLFGLVVVGRRPGAARYDVAEDEALGSACRLLAAILHNRALTVALEASLADVQRTNEELRASRTRIVTAGDAERRRIERDLHDGAQQHLLGLAVTIGLVRQMVDEGDPAADIVEVLDALGDDARNTVQELRSLAQGIYPALLMDGGVEPALRSAAGRSPVPVQLEVGRIGRYSPGLEAALYFCCLEAMQNAAKHAPDATVRIRLDERDDHVHVLVSDDGPGFDPATVVNGTGRTSMADRVGAHGGSVRWDSAPGQGTTVAIDVPVPSPVVPPVGRAADLP